MDWIDRLKAIMKDKGVNPEQLKTKIALNGHSLERNTIDDILNGKNSPRLENLEIIAKALEVDLWKIFSSEPEEDGISGFIETDDTIYRIHTLKELKQLVKIIEKRFNASKPKTNSESSEQRTLYGAGMQDYALRGGTRRDTLKLSRHIFKKYNITICDKKEFIETPNELGRDVKIWVFQSKDDEKSAQTLLEKQLKFKFNK